MNNGSSTLASRFLIFIAGNRMKLLNIILLSLSVAFFIIGVHQIMTVGFGEAYWIIMLSVLLFLLQGYLKKR